MKKLLLISSSTVHGYGYLDHAEPYIKKFLGENVKNVLFIPFARPSGISYDAYTQKAAERFKQMGYAMQGVHEHVNMVEAVLTAEAVFIGGGNSFVLLNSLYEFGLLEPLMQKIETGMPYIGSSAGSNIACPTIMTTNDMPIAYPPSFNSLDQTSFQLNPHYLDPEPDSKHKGETRETRIKEYHAYNSLPVIGLREGSMLWIEGEKIMLEGSKSPHFQEGS
jgi:dipeptidase E